MIKQNKNRRSFKYQTKQNWGSGEKKHLRKLNQVSIKTTEVLIVWVKIKQRGAVIKVQMDYFPRCTRLTKQNSEVLSGHSTHNQKPCFKGLLVVPNGPKL